MASAHFKYSPSDGDTHLQCITGDGAAEAVADSGVTPVSGHSMACVIAMNDTSGNVAFYIGGALVATSTTHLPPAGACGYQVGEAYGSSQLPDRH